MFGPSDFSARGESGQRARCQCQPVSQGGIGAAPRLPPSRAARPRDCRPSTVSISRCWAGRVQTGGASRFSATSHPCGPGGPHRSAKYQGDLRANE